MNDLLDWSKLKTFRDDKKKSFEELCFQLATEEYGCMGVFTSIDDSGGGDGVEFYLTLPNGDIWGWQCKFFGGEGRLGSGSRKKQIKKSLKRTHEVHKTKVKKWTLCTKSNFTPGENDWFFNKLPKSKLDGKQVLPDKHNVELVSWGESQLLSLLRKHPDIHRYFFTDSILNGDWFKAKASTVLGSSEVKAKYKNTLHVKERADSEIARVLGGSQFAEDLESRIKILGVEEFDRKYKETLKEVEVFDCDSKFKHIQNHIYDLIKANNDIVQKGISLLHEIMAWLRDGSITESKRILEKSDSYKNKFDDYYYKLAKLREADITKPISWKAEENENDNEKKKTIKKTRDVLLNPFFVIRNYYDVFIKHFHDVDFLDQNELHITGKASTGKTHLALNIFDQYVSSGLPSIFLFGADFKTDFPLKEQIKQLLDIPTSWSVSDFLGALNVVAKVYNTRLPIIIDGLNESLKWESIFGNNLEQLILEIQDSYPNLVIITTFIDAYRDQIFNDQYFRGTGGWKKLSEVYDYDSENNNEAISRYFEFYEIRVTGYSNAIKSLRNKLFLKIFCETKKGQRVSIQHEDIFEIFDLYLNHCENIILNHLNLNTRYNNGLVGNKLAQIASYMWENNSRDIPLIKVKDEAILNDDELYALEARDLLIFRNWRDKEIISFTYDLLGGYIIAKHIILGFSKKTNVLDFLNSDIFAQKFLTDSKRHPLWNTILRSLSVLILKQYSLSVFDIDGNSLAGGYFVNALFEVNQKYVIEHKEEVKNYLGELFQNEKKRKPLIRLFQTTEFQTDHPLNMNFLSELIFGLSTGERDLCWTEFVRENSDQYSEFDLGDFIDWFEEENKKDKTEPDWLYLLSLKAMWMLTTTNRHLRDKATRALYWYGRRYEENFIKLLKYSLSINDPYISERTLASAYGVAMSLQNRDENKEVISSFLNPMARMVYNHIFTANAPCSTTHFYSLDYARRIINIALIHESNFLSTTEIERISPPYKDGGIRNWPDEDGVEFTGERITENPIKMDFSNYTIGTLVKGGGSYSNPPEKQKVRQQIIWRIFDLGWNIEDFAGIDKRISRQGGYNRGKRPNIERYGKKYSWIAYYEMAGYRRDNGKLEDRWNELRPLGNDIDPSFPEPASIHKLIDKNLLGDDKLIGKEWIENGGLPDLGEYLIIDSLLDLDNSWVYLDGLVVQENKETQKSRFTYLRGILIKNSGYDRVVALLKQQNMRGRWLPDPIDYHSVFAGELTYLAELSNWRELEFITNTKRVNLKKGDEGYYPHMEFELEGDEMKIKETYPEEIEKDINEIETHSVLIPVAQYAGAPSEDELNKAGGEMILSKEMIDALSLKHKPQTFELFDKDNQQATISLRHHDSFNKSQNQTYLRKDLLNDFLKKENMSLVWVLWGEREIVRNEIGQPIDEEVKRYKVFQEIIEYKKE